MTRILLLFALLLGATMARAEPAAVFVGDHPTYGRVVLQFSEPTLATVTLDGSRIDVALPANTRVPTPRTVPRNVVSISGEDGRAMLMIAPGARLKSVRSGTLLILDVFDPRTRDRATASLAGTRWNRPVPPASPSPVQVAEAHAAAADTRPLAADLPATEPVHAAESRSATIDSLPPKAQAAAVPFSSQSLSAPPAIATEQTTTVSAAAQAAPASERSDLQAIRVLAAPEIGAVAFRRGNLGVIVFDEKVDLDPDNLEQRRPVERRAMQRGTMITIPLAEDESLALSREPDAWVIKPGPARGSPAAEAATPDGIAFQFVQPGRALAVTDPVTGQVLLLGTVRGSGRERTLIEAGRSAPGYILLPTWLGLALEANSEIVDLSVSLSGFALKIPDRSAPEKATVAARENQFNIPILPAEVLVRQLNAQIASAASAPPRSRGPERVAAARTMLALGMAVEAQGLLSLAANDDPAVANDPAIAALTGVAAVLAGRPEEASGLDNSALPAGGEVALWRGLRDVGLGKPAAALGSFWPTLSAYPERIRRQIAPPVLETAVRSKAPVPAAALEGPKLAFARALQQQAAGQGEAALQAFDAIANGRDERDSVRAVSAATELRLSKGQITPASAADQIERQTVRWRGDLRGFNMRLRGAELRAQAGQWRAALDALQQTETLFPDAKARIATLKTGVFRSLLAAKDAAINPLELVALAGDFADCIPDGADGEKMAGLLAEKLAALDLPSRAIPVLQRLMDRAESPIKKAEYGLRLGQLELDAGEPAKAVATLAPIDNALLDPALAERRTLLLARATAGRGDVAGAAELLATLDSPAALESRAALLAKAGDWRGSLHALHLLAARSIPEQGALTEPQQDILLREATAAVQAGDAEALAQLRRLDGRIAAPRADLFRILTSRAVESPEDLPRSARELAMSRSLPQQLSALKLP